MNVKLRQPGAVLYKYEGEDEKQQSMYIWEGMQLIGAGGKCKKVRDVLRGQSL